MTAPTLERDPAALARLEARALEGMARTLREHARQLLDAAHVRGALGSREAELQVQAFTERCAQADALLASVDDAAGEWRIARLEKLVSALECSRAYFLQLPSAATHREIRPGRGHRLARWVSLTLAGIAQASAR